MDMISKPERIKNKNEIDLNFRTHLIGLVLYMKQVC